MQKKRRVTVFTGSSPGSHPALTRDAREFGLNLARKDIGLTYGGGCVGLMGEVARSCFEAGGDVLGIIPHFLRQREGMCEFGEQIIVESIHKRKELMAERGDAFVTLAGGIGSLEEVVEQITWRQLKLHDKPSLVVNTLGFWSCLPDLIETMRRYGFVSDRKPADLLVANSVDEVLPMIFGDLDAAIIDPVEHSLAGARLN